MTVASTTQIAMINEALLDSLAVTRAYAVRSETHEWGHFIAAKIRNSEQSGTDAPIGVWFMFDGMDIPGEAFSVDDVARDHSTFASYESELGAEETLGSAEVQELLQLTRERP